MLSERDMEMESSLLGGWYNTDKYEVEAEGKSQPEVFLGFGRCKSSTRRVGN